MATQKMTIDEMIAYFKQLADNYEVCAHATDDDMQREWYLGKFEAYRNAAFELEQNLI